MMIIIVIITTVNGNCHENELAFNTSVNATPGMNIRMLQNYASTMNQKLFFRLHLRKYL